MRSDLSLDLLQYCSEHVLKLPEASRPEVADHQPEFMHSYDFSLFSSEMPGERVLVKVWRGAAQLSNDQRKQITKRISQELSTWKSLLPHPNIAAFKGLLPGYGHLPALILPLRLNAKEYIAISPGVNVLKLLVDIAEGLVHMHNRKPPIIHGKLKGSNILISAEGHAQISDIGISNIPYVLYYLTGSGDVEYARWLAPELMNSDSSDGTIQSDVYAFGMTALELLTGRPPFSHRRHAAQAIRDVVTGLRPPKERCTEVDENVWKLLEACWMHDPAKRPSACDVLRQITLIVKDTT
ncbi:hypothetical protein K443DRAFT_680168 [Laccaria amethystina LaAM-08-1]|uniref:Protein kinase domain-containing protein n=1 Tax=Laccaria amethystina LaAM-08-1 TaxID=1095629 RepID=A0A0C9WNJ7_9AGAR|nr:hypothetical protein K443DRAFT_680168 [Laccaria amethystina LaAM-08-1]